MPNDNYDPTTSLKVYFSNRTSRQIARHWTLEMLLHDLAAAGMASFFEGTASDPTTISGYASNKLWLRSPAGVTDIQGDILVWNGASPTSSSANWVALTWDRWRALFESGAHGETAADFDDRTDVAAATIVVTKNYIRVAGHTAAGDGGAGLYKRIATPSPVKAWHVASADGAYWQLVTLFVDPRQVGVLTLGSTSAATVNLATLNAGIEYSSAFGVAMVIADVGDCYIDGAVKTRTRCHIISNHGFVIKPLDWSGGGATVSNVFATADETDRLQSDVILENLVLDGSGLDALVSRGFATAGTLTPNPTLTFAVGASAVDDFYNGQSLRIFHGTGSGGTIYTVSDYVGATRVATLSSAPSSAPDTTSYYICAENDNGFGFARGAIGFRLKNCIAKNYDATWVGGGGGKGFQEEIGVDDCLMEGCRAIDCEMGFSFQGIDGTIGSGPATVPAAVRRVHGRNLTAVRCPIALLIAGYDTTKDPDGDDEDMSGIVDGLIMEDCGGAGSRPTLSTQKHGLVVLLEGQNFRASNIKAIQTAAFVPYPGAAGTVGAGLTGRVGAMIAGWGRNCDIEIECHADVDRVWFLDNIQAVGDDAAGGTFTVTIASPAVFTKTSHRLVAGNRIQLVTTGALPTGLAAATDYYVISAGLTANAFQVSTTPGGAAVNTSGSQSGTHNISGSTPGVPQNVQGNRFAARYYGNALDDVVTQSTSGGSVSTAEVQGRIVLDCVESAPAQVVGTSMAHVGLALDVTAPKTFAFTVTIATPAVFTSTAHGLSAGDRVVLATTGALPTGLSPRTDYFVIATGLTADAFQVSTVPAGTAVNTSGSQSGSHALQHFYGAPQRVRVSGSASGINALPDTWSDFLAGDTYAGDVVHANTGLQVRGTSGAFALTMKPGSAYTAARTITWTTGDQDITVTFSGNPTLANWFDQSVKTTASPRFEAVGLNDSDDSHALQLVTTSNLTADRQLTFVTGDQSITVTFSGSPTLANWFDQDVRSTASPQFAAVNLGHATNTTVAQGPGGAGTIGVEGVQVPSGAWTLLSSSTTIASGKITITNLSQAYTELLIFAELGSHDNASAALVIEADMVNGAGGFPLSVVVSGAFISTSLHSGSASLLNYSIAGATKYLMRQGWSNTGLACFDSDATADTVDAVRLSSTAGNIDAGTLYVFAR